MTRTPSRHIARGAALPLALILLGVLTVIATAAVTLASRDKVNAGAYSRMDAVYACANAAVAKLWAELGVHGTTLVGSTALISSLTLPDGTKLTAPAHYDTPAGVTVGGLVSAETGTAGQKKSESDDGNKPPPTIQSGQTYSFTAHCKDANGRELEVEVGLRFEL